MSSSTVLPSPISSARIPPLTSGGAGNATRETCPVCQFTKHEAPADRSSARSRASRSGDHSG